MRLSREKILDAGLEILDSYGLADMTMRRLATHLGVAPGALYWHFANKQALIESIAREILTPALRPTSTTSDPDPEKWCTVLRSTLLLHRDGAELVVAAVSMTSLYDELLEVLTAQLEAFNQERRTGAASLLHFTLGSTALEQSAHQAAEATGGAATQLPDAADFERGLQIILTGMKTLEEQ
ncbi:Tetracycline repressor protein class H [Corynebacterium occultum]|uniref:Tetracycline repressor protein class H n=2 Tax=Corynebacterium occultum TaxID=2675219 RepID=A0A6B8W5C6_9CORY|nr:Tetracycline repressor protein class H [Corynebacterium occultum]